MTQPLSEFIASVRLASSVERERFIITSEQADIRTYIRECDPLLRPRIVAKMLFLATLGENVAYGQMEVLTLMSHEVFSFKRIGYVAATVMLDEASELTVLITHTIVKDLQNPDPKIQCLALSLLANIGSAEMCRTVSSEVQKLIGSSDANVMKRAAMAAVRIVDRVPDLAENFKPSVQRLLKHGSHGVVISAINLMGHIIKSDSSFIPGWEKYAPAFTKILKQLSTSKASREFSFTIFNDPFLQIKIMKILAVLKMPSDDLDDALEAITTGVEIKRNTGRALLFQAVETIVATAKKPSLRGLAFAQIGRLFQFKEANVLYSALSVFSRVLYSGREIIGRTSGDSIALQRYKTQVVQCLNHRDPSIRRRALDVVSALVDEKNVETLIPEVLDYVKLADSEFRVELVAKIFTAVQRFAPNPIWNFDTIHRILIDSGNYVGSDIITSISRLLIHTPSIQAHAVRQLGGSIMNFSSNQTLMQVSAWVLGEFSTVDDGSYENLRQIMDIPQTTDITKGYIITALAKLAVRFNKKPETIEYFNSLNTANNLDVQQRAGEMAILLSNNELCDEVLAPVESDSKEGAELIVSPQGEQEEAEDDLLLDISGKAAAEKSSNPIKDLLGLGTPVPAPAQTEAAKAQPSVQPSAQQAPAQLAPRPNPGSVEALKKTDYIIYFEVIKNPQDPRQIAIRSSIFGLGKNALNKFSVKYGVPVGWQLKASAPSGNVLEPVGGQPIVQQLLVSSQGNTRLLMKVQVQYLYGSQPINEVGEINPIFN
jgi:AP-1 complex subunit gamma-1